MRVDLLTIARVHQFHVQICRISDASTEGVQVAHTSAEDAAPVVILLGASASARLVGSGEFQT